MLLSFLDSSSIAYARLDILPEMELSFFDNKGFDFIVSEVVTERLGWGLGWFTWLDTALEVAVSRKKGLFVSETPIRLLVLRFIVLRAVT